MRNYDILTYISKKDKVLHIEKIQYLTITPSHAVYFETLDGRRGECTTEDIQNLECDKRETMM